jgi:hypothetical protein
LSALTGRVLDVRAMNMIGMSAGLTFRNVGGFGMVRGRTPIAAEIAELTSTATASTLRSNENWMLIVVAPSVLVELIESMPAIAENCFSSGVATVAAMVSGLAPGRNAVTLTLGKSTSGRLLIGKFL